MESQSTILFHHSALYLIFFQEGLEMYITKMQEAKKHSILCMFQFTKLEMLSLGFIKSLL